MWWKLKVNRILESRGCQLVTLVYYAGEDMYNVLSREVSECCAVSQHALSRAGACHRFLRCLSVERK